MRVGVVGTGRIGGIHTANLVRHADVTSVVVTDVVPEAAAGVAAEHEIATAVDTLDDVAAMADVVVVCSPAETHVPLIEWAVENRFPVFCEKPLAMSLAEADRAVAVAGSGVVPVQIGFNRRFDPGYRNAQAMVADGTLGTVTLLIGQHHDFEMDGPEYLAISGGEFKDQLIHDLDILRYVTGQEVERLHAAGTTTGFDWVGDFDDFAHTAVTLWMDGGALAVLCGSRRDPVGYDVRLEVFGTEDSIAVGLDERTPIRSVEPGVPSPTDPYREWVPRFGHTYDAEMRAFLALAEGQGPNHCTVHDGRVALALAEACMLSAREGRILDPREVG